MVLWKRRRIETSFSTIRTEDEWDEIVQRFREEGVDPTLPPENKLLYVWRWLVDAETNCISLRHQLDKLSRRQSDELEEIRSCMEQMCSAWEAKVCKLEEENQRVQEEMAFGAPTSRETGRLLAAAGLQDAADLPVVQQVAYLLELRSQLQSQLEQESSRRRKCEQLIRVSSNLPDCLKLSSPHVQRILDRQKDEYEEEMRHQQEAMKVVKEQLKQVHEDELQRLTTENNELKSELSQISQKLQELVSHLAEQDGKKRCDLPWVQHILNGTHEKEGLTLKKEAERLQTLCQEQQKQIREQCETVHILQRTNKQMEIDNETLAFKLSESLAQFDELEEQLRRETRFRNTTINKHNLNKVLDNRPSSSEQAFGDQMKHLKEESSTLKEQLESVQQQLEMMSLKYQQHKERYREKIYRLRDLQEQEHREWRERFQGCDQELSVLREMLTREQEWRVQVEADCRRLKTDNQQLKNGILEKENCEVSEVAAVQREVEKIKASRPTNTPSPSRRVWPLAPSPKQW